MARPLTFFHLFLTFLLFPSTTSPSPLHSFIYGGCSLLKYSNPSYQTNLNSLLSSLVNSATYSSYNHFSLSGTSSPNDVVYGLYQCRGDLSSPDCSSCVSHSVSQLAGFCPGSCGAAIQLEGCFVKYDNDTFVGREDKMVVFKKCGGPQLDGDGNGIGPEKVLDGLVDGSGPYRVVGSKGMAQCVGDLSEGECQECVGEAVKQVKMACGKSGNGDMYLGKCYVRFNLAGAPAYFNSHAGSDKNRGVKTFALVIGLLAAIAILIIFLTFICRTFKRSGK